MTMTIALLALAAAAVATPSAAPQTEITIPGPTGPLAGTLTDAGKGAPVVVIIPGSGPTDRNGDNPLGVAAAPYRLLAEGLAARNVSTLRIDKRGMFGSKSAIADANAVAIADYAGDALGWVAEAAKRTGNRCAWLLGHSEGGLVALKAAQTPRGLCGVILLSAPGTPLAGTMKAQLRANPANAPILAPVLAAMDSLAAGKRVDPATLPAPLPRLFPAAVQGFMIDLFAQDPAAEATRVTVPMLIVQGDRDIQVPVTDAQTLAKAAPKATLAVLPGGQSRPEDGRERRSRRKRGDLR
ncbi:alpha/beta hydrolase [Sphingomonas oligophenolica]|uniref:alpha/beta hydrolase n=1 Tax=Sphingomonas oligophenolica TaxID=301154 RepID=UPI001F4F5935|nr:alpha/beta fold hydrolase [Sphingomonas oligophenolica]